MSRSAKKRSSLASPSTGLTLSSVEVKIGSRVRLLDGTIVRVAAEINGGIFVRESDKHGPWSMPRDTPVVEVLPAEVSYADRSAVKDPLE
jgi:hypothetical protein